MNPIPWLLVALLVLAVSVLPKERFQPEFLDKTQVRRTVSHEDSSYYQATNHVTPAPYSMGPIVGMESPFQVNQYRAYIA